MVTVVCGHDQRAMIMRSEPRSGIRRYPPLMASLYQSYQSLLRCDGIAILGSILPEAKDGAHEGSPLVGIQLVYIASRGGSYEVQYFCGAAGRFDGRFHSELEGRLMSVAVALDGGVLRLLSLAGSARC